MKTASWIKKMRCTLQGVKTISGHGATSASALAHRIGIWA